MTNLTSNLNTILARIINFDPSGDNKLEIDTKKEFDLLGNYLNGTQSLDNLKQADQLEKNDFEFLTNLYENLKNSFKDNSLKNDSQLLEKTLADIESLTKESSDKDIKKILKKINKDNILNISYINLRIFFHKTPQSDFKQENYEYIKNLYLEKIDELINNPLFIKRQEYARNSNLNDIKNILDIQKEYIEEIRSSTCNNGKDGYYNIGCLEEYLKDIQKAISTQKEMDRIEALNSDPNDTRSELQKFAENEYLKDGGVNNKGFSNADGDISTAGAKQNQAGNCWLLGGINSLAATDGGKKLLKDNIYIDDIHGYVVVKLKEAENKGLGRDGKGIYFVPINEIKYGLSISGIGDPDILAYNYAINQYFQESNENNENNSKKYNYTYESLRGNTSERFYEIITGEKCTKLNDLTNIPDGTSAVENYDKSGIKENTDDIYNSLYAAVENKKSVLLSMHLVESSRLEYGNGIIKSSYNILQKSIIGTFDKENIISHGFSVVGTKDGALVCQESNNSEEFAKAFPVYWQDENGTWNFLLEKQTFKNSPIRISILNL